MKAYYCLSTKPATFDFVTFLVTAKTLGATEIVFDVSKGFQKKKFSQDIAKQMYENVLQPACGIWDMPFTEGTEGDFTPGYRTRDLIEAYYGMGQIAKPEIWVEREDYITVTLRDSIRNKHRDSNRAAWMKFAEERNAIVIDDAYIHPISLIGRFKLYGGATMNYSVVNGPAALCMFSSIPYVSFCPKAGWPSWSGENILPGFQMPWATDEQKIVWFDDTYENINDYHNSSLKRQTRQIPQTGGIHQGYAEVG